MTDRKFIMDLAKLVIAAAWADGELKNEEVNSLKDLLFNLEDVTGKEWAQLQMYMDSPVTPEETEELLRSVLSQIKSDDDKELVISTLENLFGADGVISGEELVLLEKIKDDVSQVSTGLLARLSKMLPGSLAKRDTKYTAGAQRDTQVDDFIENRIYYQLKSLARKKGIDIDMPDEKARQACLAAGLMARISAVDSGISEQETQTIKDVLGGQWDLSEQEAEILAELSCEGTLKGLDYFRLSRSFFECTSLEQRRDFIKYLFKVANASEKTSYDETEEIRRIAKSLKLSHRDFIDAKLTIPDENRELL